MEKDRYLNFKYKDSLFIYYYNLNIVKIEINSIENFQFWRYIIESTCIMESNNDYNYNHHTLYKIKDKLEKI